MIPAIRPERALDAAAIRAVLKAAFGGAAEAELVERLRADNDLVLALVAVDADGPVGHLAFPRLTVATSDGEVAAVGLAPLAVAPAHQRRGIGSALARTGLDMLAASRETLVFVLGEPDYYARFGFDAAAGADYSSTYAGPYFMALRLAAHAPRRGAVRYPQAFARLG